MTAAAWSLHKGNNVFVGTAAFMNLMGIRIPQNVDVAGLSIRQ